MSWKTRQKLTYDQFRSEVLLKQKTMYGSNNLKPHCDVEMILSVRKV